MLVMTFSIITGKIKHRQVCFFGGIVLLFLPESLQVFKEDKAISEICITSNKKECLGHVPDW